MKVLLLLLPIFNKLLPTLSAVVLTDKQTDSHTDRHSDKHIDRYTTSTPAPLIILL